mmetsp:Transcript_5909/g.18265  ORF Transcript_5909/g.18265 Transcript_5909/m.18265 type:complete len:518 (-) Transcript_5909:25-1578(-)
MTTLNADATRKILTYAECDGIDAWRATNKFARETASDDLVWRAAATRDFYGGAGAGRDYHGQPVDFSPAPATPEAPASRSNGAPCERVNHPETWREAYVRWRRLALRVDGPRDNYPRYANAPRTVWQESVHERPRGERRERRCGDPFHAPTWLGVCAAWRAIKAALAGTPAVASLRPPASQKDLAYVGARSLRYCYAVHDGQALAFDEAIRSQNRRQMKAAQATIFHGIFGGFSAYDYVVCTRFRPIAAVVAEIAATDEEEAGSGDELANKQGNWTCHHMFSFGANYRGDRRFQVCSADRVMFVEGNARAAPDGPDAFLRWFAEYARRVAARAYRVAPIMPDAPDVSAGVVLFPDADAGDDCRVVEAVTNGVRVRASSVYLPNHPSGFAYSIRLARTEGEPCQLMSRHWKIFDGSRTNDVVGDGVIGKFPVLREGGWRDDHQVANMGHGFAAAVDAGEDRSGEFVYQSMSGRLSGGTSAGSFRGEIEFFPGEVASPTGPPFRAAVPEFPLRRGRFIY